MENLERELELAKMENILLRLHRAFQNFKRSKNEDAAHELGVGLVDKIQTYLAMLPGKVESLRQKVLSMSGATKEERVKILDEIKKTEADKLQWEDTLNNIEMYLGIKEAPHKPEWWEAKPKRPDVSPLPKAEPYMAEKPKTPGFKIIKKNPATASEIQSLIRIANHLDQNGFYAEADIIDSIIVIAANIAAKNTFIKALKDNDLEAAYNAIVGLSGEDFGMTHDEFRKMTSKLSAINRGGVWPDDVMDDIRKMLGVSKNVDLNPATHNPLTGQPYSGPMPKGFCPECGKKLVMRYPGGDPENGPAGLRCPQYHQAAEPCELCPHFFHNDQCKECDCYSSWGTKQQQEEEHEIMKKLYGDDYDQNPDPQDFLP